MELDCIKLQIYMWPFLSQSYWFLCLLFQEEVFMYQGSVYRFCFIAICQNQCEPCK